MEMHLLLLVFVSLFAHTLCVPSVVINVANITHAVSPTLFGIFFEEINHAGEGGIYAELIQNRAFDSLPGPPTSVAAAPPKYVSIAAVSIPTFFLRHCDFLAYFTQIDSDLDENDSTFILSPGLANSSYVSFESINYPGYFLRNLNQRLILANNDGSKGFLQDASFLQVPALDGSENSSFKTLSNLYLLVNSTNDGGCTISVKYDAYLVPYEDSQAFKTNATFAMSSPTLNPLFPWASIEEGTAVVNISTDDSSPLNNVSGLAAKIIASQYSTSSYAGIANAGFWGINAQEDTYTLSFFARAEQDFIANGGELILSIESLDASQVYAKALSAPLTSKWTQQVFSLDISSEYSDSDARFAIRLSAEGTVYLDVVSLFPSTFNNRPNGLRKDLAATMVDLAPSFLRFPGGCYVEGQNKETAYYWKNSTGPIEQRPGHYSFWSYWSTDGLGFLEYLILCEDLKAAPVWVAHIGIFTGDDAIPVADLDPWVQDALDSIEYANGDTSTVWGAKRAADGHPEPFNIEIIALGNENGCGFDKNHIYVQYYEIFATRFRATYPKIKLIANCDISAETPLVDYFDVHLYESPQWFVNNSNMFDTYSRSGPQAFVSEYAVTSDCGIGNVQAAVAEAAFMVGFIRNSDVVALASYAPLFVNVNNRYWSPDAIQFNSSAVAPTPSYYVQQLFMKYTGTQVPALSLSGATPGLSAVASFTPATGSLYIPIVNFAANATEVSIQVNGAQKLQSLGEVYVIGNADPNAQNSLETPTVVVPSSSTFQVPSSSFVYTAPPYSVSILVLTAAV